MKPVAQEDTTAQYSLQSTASQGECFYKRSGFAFGKKKFKAILTAKIVKSGYTCKGIL